MPPTPAHSRIFGFLDFSENVDFWDFPVGFGVWEGLQSIGNGCGLQLDGFSAHFEPCGSIFDNFSDFYDFRIVFEGGLRIGGCKIDDFAERRGGTPQTCKKYKTRDSAGT